MAGQLATQNHLPRPARCANCPYGSRTCASKGPVDSPFVIVGESPGTTEISKNMPFVGPSGQLLKQMLKSGIEPYFTNAVHCMPKNKDLSNLATAAQACSGRLRAEIVAHPRKIILALGNAAVWSLLGDYTSKISQARGHIYPSPLADYGIVACLHPAALLRGFGSSRLFKRDIHLACDLVFGDSPLKYKDTETLVLETESDVRYLIDLAQYQPLIASDVETTGFSPRTDYLLSQGFCFDSRSAYIVPPHLFHLIGDMYDPTVVPGRYIWHNGKFDVGFLRGAYKKEHSDTIGPKFLPFIRHNLATVGNRYGYQFAATHEDTMLLSYAIDENGGIHGLEVLANDLLSAPHWKGVIDAWLPKKGASYANVPPNILYNYQGKDLGVTWQIFPILRELVRSDPLLEKLYQTTLLPASETLTGVESNGMEMDPEIIAANDISVSIDIQDKMEKWQEQSRLSGQGDTNPNSWQQVQRVLYRGGLDIANGRVLKTDAKTLQAFPAAPVVKVLQDVREAKKLHSQYIVSLREAIEPDGRVYSSYLIHGTRTGRLSSRDPNLQNIVRDDRIKNQFRAATGRWILSVDLSQAELRVLACLSGDPTLCEIFASGVSIHPIVARRFYGDNYNKDQYQLAKAVTFGIVYGRDAFSISLEYQIPVKQAQEYIDSWFGQFPLAKKFIFACRMAPLNGQILKTPWGRKRRFGVVGPERIHEAGNEGANFPPQSMASDITLEAATLCRPTLWRWNVPIINLVHDDIMTEPKRDIEQTIDVINLIQNAMKEIPKRRGLVRVPFDSEYKIGTHWGSLQENKSNLPVDLFLKKIYNLIEAGGQNEAA